MLNDALRSSASQEKLLNVIAGTVPHHHWRTRVEPAFSRALDYLAGERFADWLVSSDRTSLQLTDTGKRAAESIVETDDALTIEKQFLNQVKSSVSESFVRSVLLAGTRLL